MLLQLGPRSSWGNLLGREFAPARRPVLLSTFSGGGYEPRHLLQVLAQMWQQGVRIDWKGYHSGEQRFRVPLPTYPFERASHWLAVPQAPGPLTQPALQPAPQTSSQRFFVPAWRVAASEEITGIATPGECWLILSDGAAGEPLASRLQEQGHVPVLVLAAAEFGQLAEHKYRLAIDSTADYTRLLQELQARGLQPRRIVHCWTLLNEEGVPGSLDRFAQRHRFGYFSLLNLSKALAASSPGSPRSILVVTRGTYRIADSDAACELANATLPGLCKVLGQELPDVRKSAYCCKPIPTLLM